MAVVLTCSCGADVRLPKGQEQGRVLCPRCGSELRPGSGEPIQKSAAPAPPAPAASPAPNSPVVEVVPDPDLLEKDRKRATRAQRRGLRLVHLGLAFHYGGAATFAVAIITAAVTLGLAGIAHSPKLESAAGPATFFAYISAVFFLLTGLVDAVPSLLGLAVIDAHARAFFGVSFVLRCGGCLLACLVFPFPDYAPGHLGLASLAMLIAWGLWMGGLFRVGCTVNRKDITEGVTRITFRGLTTLGLALATLFIVSILLVIGVRFPFLLFIYPPVGIAMALRVMFVLGEFDSILRFFGTPTGIPFLIDYFNFITGVRTVLERRA
jgi:hypothetical protein